MEAPSPSHSALAASPPAPPSLVTGDPEVVIRNTNLNFQVSYPCSSLAWSDFLCPAEATFFLTHQPRFKHHLLAHLLKIKKQNKTKQKTLLHLCSH